MLLDVYGRRVLVRRERDAWCAYYPGNEGKRRLAGDITIPSDLAAGEVIRFVADLCHEWATPARSRVRRLD